ncbi:AAA family ATPase [Scytonema sp. PCC 10023]|uniref:AAA family ATPase n=1 Tax=Scytonema sp. PCC 10023 TaxID=1680591 RepID=UPI0039C64BB0
MQSGLYLICDGDFRLAVMLRGASEYTWRSGITIEVMASERTQAEVFLAQLRNSIRKRNVYRGRVVSLVESEDRRGMNVQFHRLPSLNRDDIILPDGLLQRIERQSVGFSRVADKLRTARRHLKRGMLLYGPPGTGKTLTAMYLASQMPDRTIILLTGRGMGLIEKSCEMARLLQPATLIVEDVDLIAEERTSQNKSCNAVLFEQLNQMDGLNEDADILFILTTNRPETLEPALAARPGRVDTAIEIPLPDATCRQRLFELYSKGLKLSLENLDPFIARTEGVSAAFIRELMRKAALFAADEGNEMLICDRHLDEALYELVELGGELTHSILGAGKAFS